MTNFSKMQAKAKKINYENQIYCIKSFFNCKFNLFYILSIFCGSTGHQGPSEKIKPKD
jgi:hypothetical protein